MTEFEVFYPKISTFPPNKHFPHNKLTFFGLTKMCLLWVGTAYFLKFIYFLLWGRRNLWIIQHYFFIISVYEYNICPYFDWKYKEDKLDV